MTAPKNRHGKAAASASKLFCDSDEAVRAVVAQLKALPNVTEVESPADALAALRQFGVRPRAEFGEPNGRILTISRRDEANDVFYTFAYSYLFELERDAAPYTFTLSLEGEGAPYHIDDWTGP
jgi:hypothetical protein